MNRYILFTICLLLISLSIYAQKDNLSEQELRVIKSYQFDVSDTKPILSSVVLDLPEKLMAKSTIEVDLLPVKLEDVTYSIKPLAHQTDESKYYKGYASGAIGTFQMVDIQASFRHQAPNYFMYGIDLDYANINDKSVRSKKVNDKKGSAFLRYYLKPTFWFQYKTEYNFNQTGIFGFNDNSSTISNGEIREEQYRRNFHDLDFFKRFKKIDTDIQLTSSLFSARNIRFAGKEHLLKNNLNISKKFNNNLSLEINSNHTRQITTINNSQNEYLVNTRLGLSYLKPKFGLKVEGLASIGEAKKILPIAELYIKGKAHSLTAFYRNDVNLNTFYDNQDEINLIHLESYNTSVSTINSIGLEYVFELQKTHSLRLGARKEKRSNDQIWVNNTNDIQYFSFQLFDYNQYVFDLEYRIFLLRNLSFNQSVSYRLLEDLESKDIPHFQAYTLNSGLEYTLQKFTFSLEYILGDKVSYVDYLPDYPSTSDFQHTLNFETTFRLSKTLKISLVGLDLIDNRFEAYGGYQGFGRRGKVKVTTKF